MTQRTMTERAGAFWRSFIPKEGRNCPAADPTSRIEIRDFGPARFRHRNHLGADGDPLELTLLFSSMRVERGISTVEIRIRDHGLMIDGVVEGREGQVLIYLGNYFIVPRNCIEWAWRRRPSRRCDKPFRSRLSAR